MDIDEKCPLCGETMRVLFTDGKDFFILRGQSPDFSIYFCDSCKIGFSYPILNEEELKEYYPDNYEAYVPKNNLLAILQIKKYKSDLKKIIQVAHSDKKLGLYEIGAGRGEFLNVAITENFNVNGSEPGLIGVKYAKENYRIELTNQYSDEIKFSQKYDIVVLRHVLEHINDFTGCLKNILDNGLTKDGVLFLKLPRTDSWEARFFGKYWHGYDLPRHRVHFTKKGIKKLLDNIGYSGICIKNEVVPYDTIRSIEYYGKCGQRKICKFLAKIFSSWPQLLKISLAYLAGILLFYKAGRMVVFAKRS